MTFKSLKNKFLLVREGVVLTEHIDPVIFALDEVFRKANMKATVTSGLRTAADQLRIIRNELNRRGLSQDYQEAFEDIGKKIQFNGEEVYGWQVGWSKLLNAGFIVNPPYPAVCLFDYFRPGSNKNRKGQIIGSSPHFHGTAFDVSGGANGISDEGKLMAGQVGKIPGLKGCLLERNNNAVHVDCIPIDITIYK